MHGAEDEVPVGAGQPAGQRRFVSFRVVRLEAEAHGDAAAELPLQPRDLLQVAIELILPHCERRVAVALRQEVERNVVREGDLGKPAFDRFFDEVARSPAGVAATERVNVVVRQALHGALARDKF